MFVGDRFDNTSLLNRSPHPRTSLQREILYTIKGISVSFNLQLLPESASICCEQRRGSSRRSTLLDSPHSARLSRQIAVFLKLSQISSDSFFPVIIRDNWAALYGGSRHTSQLTVCTFDSIENRLISVGQDSPNIPELCYSKRT